MRIACVRFAGSMTTNCACAGTARITVRTTLSTHRRNMTPPSVVAPSVSLVHGQLEVAGEIYLHAVPFANRDGRQPVQKTVHHLQAGLCGRIGRTAGDDDRAITAAAADGRRADVLREAADQAHGARRAKRRPVVVIDAIAEPRIADVIETQGLIEAVRPP